MTKSVRHINDGLSKTIFGGEVSSGHVDGNENTWTVATRLNASLRSTRNPINTPPKEGFIVPAAGNVNGAYSSQHAGGANFFFADGHATFISENIEQDIYEALSTRDSALWPYADRPEPNPTDY